MMVPHVNNGKLSGWMIYRSMNKGSRSNIPGNVGSNGCVPNIDNQMIDFGGLDLFKKMLIELRKHVKNWKKI